MADWCRLPADILSLIAGKLISNNGYLEGFHDYLAFGFTCKSWRSAQKAAAFRYPHILPLLILPYNEVEKTYHAFSPSDDKMFQLKLSNLPGLRYVGSFDGWLVTVDTRPIICLWNIFSGEKIKLPPVTTFQDVVAFRKSRLGMEYSTHCVITGFIRSRGKESFRDFYITKAVLSSDPVLDPNFVIMVIHDQLGQLAFCRHGDDKWTEIEQEWIITEDGKGKRAHLEILYYDKHFYTVDTEGRVLRCELHASPPQVVEVIPPTMYARCNWSYLVESCGELFQVLRIFGVCSTVQFKVFHLDLNRRKRFELNTIGEYALFLGLNGTACLSIHDFPGLRRNCIYFTDDPRMPKGIVQEGGNDIGVFDLEDNSTGKLSYASISNLEMVWPPPIWLHVPHTS